MRVENSFSDKQRHETGFKASSSTNRALFKPVNNLFARVKINLAQTRRSKLPLVFEGLDAFTKASRTQKKELESTSKRENSIVGLYVC